MKDETEIEEMRNRAADAVDAPKYHGMTYEQGVQAALDWVLGDVDEDIL